MTKEEAAKLLTDKYLDGYGRVQTSLAHWADSLEGKYENNNMLLFSGEAVLLLHKCGLLSDEAKARIVAGMLKCEFKDEPGLYSRHPLPYRNREGFDVVSHDEYNGLCYMDIVTEFAIAEDIVAYGEKTGYSYCDLYPGLSFIKAFFRSPIKTTLNLIKLINHVRKGTEYRFNVGEAEILTYKRVPRDVAFYKLCSVSHSPSIFSVLWMCIATVATLRKPLDYKNGSGRMMAVYRMWALEENKACISGLHNVVLSYTHKKFRKGLEEQYGENYVEELHRMYFDLDKNHPFHTLCRGFK